MPYSIPVFLYHYVNSLDDPISVKPRVFEDHLRLLTRAGYVGAGLDEVYAFLKNGRVPERKPVLLTFDDGFLDNYTHAWPLLEKYGHKAVIFAVTSRIENCSPRPTLKEAWAGDVAEGEIDAASKAFSKDAQGLVTRNDHFLSWAEARAMEASGAVRIEAHSHAHSAVFTSPEFRNVLRPRSSHRTLDRVWNTVLWGMPRFPTGPFFSGKAYLPSEEVHDFLRASVPQDQAEAFRLFQDKSEMRKLTAHFKSLPAERLGRFETEEECRQRMRAELTRCIDTLTTELDRRPLALAWPWGTSSPMAIEEAERLGIELFFDTTIGPNTPGNFRHINRFKARNQGAVWLYSRLAIFRRPWLASLYRRVRI